MSQYPPQYPQPQPGYGYAPIPGRGNGAAVASLVFGVLGCIPFLPGLLAVIFGFVGMRKARDPMVSGKGLAIAGFILGLLSLIGWGSAGGFFGYMFTVEVPPAKKVAEQFLKDVTAGNIDAAVANSQLAKNVLKKNNEDFDQFGTFQSVIFNSFNFNSHNGQTTVDLGGVATFSNGPKTCTFTLIKQGAGYKVVSYWVK